MVEIKGFKEMRFIDEFVSRFINGWGYKWLSLSQGLLMIHKERVEDLIKRRQDRKSSWVKWRGWRREWRWRKKWRMSEWREHGQNFGAKNGKNKLVSFISWQDKWKSMIGGHQRDLNILKLPILCGHLWVFGWLVSIYIS